MAVFGDEPLEAVTNAKNVADTVSIVKLQHDRSDDVVETRTKTAASHHRALELAGIEIDFFPGAGNLDGWKNLPFIEKRGDVRYTLMEQDPVRVADELTRFHGGFDTTFPQLLNA
jgi:hypothetical protein